MTTEQIVLGIVIGVAAGVLSGLFGVGGGIVTTPAIQELLGGTPYIAVGTPLPVAIPTALVGGYTYARAHEVSWRAVRFAAIPGMAGAAAGAWLTSLIDPHWLLLVTAGLIGWQAVRIGRSSEYRISPRGSTPGWQYAALGGFTGLVSGLLGVGGGIIFVPFVTTMLGMPLKRALGTSLVLIAVIAIPGTLVHAALGHIDWEIAFVLALGVIPGARVGASIALGTRERTLRLMVGAFLLVVGVVYGAAEIARLARG
ncbi:MAG: sulfite exporter TauE/SafE family protein [Actinomycetota bacterium]|nr:sulfite exporter TauE/SafE family protein [Actinomycetota bacterium]